MPERLALKGKKVLIVDDEPDVLQVLEELLSMCHIVMAASFHEAKRLLESEYFDFAILDIMGVDGYGLLEIAKKRDVTAVMLTANAFTPDHVVKSIKEGAASYVPKDEISNITDFLNDILEAGKAGKSPWEAWQERLPASYFEKRFGAAWRDKDKAFWDTFQASLRAKSTQKK